MTEETTGNVKREMTWQHLLKTTAMFRTRFLQMLGAIQIALIKSDFPFDPVTWTEFLTEYTEFWTRFIDAYDSGYSLLDAWDEMQPAFNNLLYLQGQLMVPRGYIAGPVEDDSEDFEGGAIEDGEEYGTEREE